MQLTMSPDFGMQSEIISHLSETAERNDTTLYHSIALGYIVDTYLFNIYVSNLSFIPCSLLLMYVVCYPCSDAANWTRGGQV